MNADNEQLAERLSELISSFDDRLHQTMHEGFIGVYERLDMINTSMNRDDIRNLERKRKGAE